MRVRFQQSSRHGQNGTNHSNFAHARYGFRMIDRFLNWGDRHGGKTADWLLISRVILLSADLSVMAQQSLKNCEFFTSVTQQIQQEMQK